MGKDARYFVDPKNNNKNPVAGNKSEQNTNVSDRVPDKRDKFEQSTEASYRVFEEDKILVKQKLEEIYLKITDYIALRESRFILKDKPAAKPRPFRTAYKGKIGTGAKAPVFFELKPRKVSYDEELPSSFSAIDLEKIKKETDPESFGEYLAFLREQKEMTVEDFCARAVINRSLYYSYLNRTKSPRKDTLKRMILILRLTKAEAEKLWTLCGFGMKLFEDKVFFAIVENNIYDIVLINCFLQEKGIEQIEIPPER